MGISPGLGVAIMMNNYFHDVATALLAASAFALWVLWRVGRDQDEPGADRFFLAAHRRFVTLARVALVWIVLGGIPRTVFYRDFEWANAAGRGQVPALVVKHVLMFALVGLGVWGWLALRRRVAEVRARVENA